VKNRTVGFFLALLACVPLLVFHASGSHLLMDTDTSFLISKLDQYHNPWRWFTHDWPLENHFYRPISTLFFELDNRLHPGNNDAFGFTNSAICALATMTLYWFLCEVRRSIPVAVGGTWLFMSWSLNGWFFGKWWMNVISLVPIALMIVILVRMIAEKKFRWSALFTGLGGFFVWSELTQTMPSLSDHTMYWLPGRTATSMTIFALIALASYVRFERLGASSLPAKEPSPLDPPATRSSNQRDEPRNAWGRFALSCVATVMALGAYEQAVMIPALIFILGIWLRISGLQTRFAIQIIFWGILVTYIIYRVQIIPVQPSGYQKQQFRHGPGLYIDILSYIMPGIFGLTSSVSAIMTGFLVVTDTFWASVGSFVANASAWISIRKRMLKPAIAMSLALFAYLPMAFLKQFGHYHYFPAAMFALFVICLFEAYWQEMVKAISPSSIQAPKRTERAPGSLPRI
jgi:hypothetical protein